MRRYGKVDKNQKEIADAFRKLGCSFLSLAPLGKGAPDAAIGYGGLTCLVEVKNCSQESAHKKLTDKQKDFWRDWKGGVRLVTDMKAVEETVNLLRNWRAKLSK